MKNDELESLTELAADISHSMCKLYLDGDGTFIDAHSNMAVPASDILRMVTVAKRKAHALHIRLRDLPRRASPTTKDKPA